MNCLKSPVNRIGGKFFLSTWIASFSPEHTCYVEPFCGAGHLLFSKLPSPVEIINDIDGHLISFFKVIQHPETRQMLIEKLNYMPYSRSLWNELRSQWKSGNILGDEIERVSRWYYLNSTCFGGDFRYGGFKIPSVTGRNPIRSFRNSINTFDIVSERLKNVCIENLPYAECIKRYDSPETLFYCDPPYLNTEHYYDYGKGCFTLEDHYRLSELLNNIKGQAMVSHYSNSLYDDLYKGWNRYEYQSFKGSHKSTGGEKPKTVEVLYTNFETVKTQGLFNGAV